MAILHPILMILILYGTSVVTVWCRHLFITGSGLIVRGGRCLVFPPDNGRFWILSSHRVVARTKSNLFGRVRTRWTTSSRERAGKKVKRREEQPRVSTELVRAISLLRHSCHLHLLKIILYIVMSKY
jgi:hypothetical protein